MVTFQDFDGFQSGDITITVWEESGRDEKLLC
jgi:hypothetical protein